MALTVLDHPLAGDLLARLRDERTDPADFRQLTRRLGWLLVVEAGSTPAEAVEQALRRIGDRPNLSLLLNRCGYAWAGQRRSRTLQQALFRRRTSSGGPMRRRVRKTTALLFAAAMLGTAAGLWFPEHMLRSFTPLPSPIDPPADWRSTADMLRAMS